MKHVWIPILLLPTLSVTNATFAQKAPAKTEQKAHKKYTQAEIFELVKKAIKEEGYDEKIAPITLKSAFVNEIGFDSLDVVSFILRMETEFDITISDALLESMTTVQDAVEVIEDLLTQQQKHVYLTPYSAQKQKELNGVKMMLLRYNPKTQKYSTPMVLRFFPTTVEKQMKFPNLKVSGSEILEVEIPKGYQLIAYSETQFKGKKTLFSATEKPLLLHLVQENVYSFVVEKKE